jgi:hypothetical protein
MSCNQRELEHRAVVRFAQNNWNLRKVQELRRAPAPFTGDDFKMIAAVANDERLNNPLLANGIRQFAQRFGWKILPRLECAGPNAIKRHALDAIARVNRGCRRGHRNAGGRSRLSWFCRRRSAA